VLSPLAALPLDEARRNSEAITRAMRALRCADPEGGGCLYESAYDLPDWRKAYWGASSSRLETIKTRYDQDGLFRVHHGVGTADRSLDHTSARCTLARFTGKFHA